MLKTQSIGVTLALFLGGFFSNLRGGLVQDGFVGMTKDACCADSVVIIGNQAKFKFSSTDPDAAWWKRAELARWGLGVFPFEAWYGFRVKIDPTWTDSVGDPNGTVVAQWHQIQGVTYPHAVLYVGSETFRPRHLYFRLDGNPIAGQPLLRRDWDLGPYVKGQWYSFVLHAKWSASPSGFIELWKDNVKALEHVGQNGAPNAGSQAFKCGIYRPFWGSNLPPTPTTLIDYIDSLKIGDSNSNYQEVAPNVSLIPPPPKNLNIASGESLGRNTVFILGVFGLLLLHD